MLDYEFQVDLWIPIAVSASAEGIRYQKASGNLVRAYAALEFRSA